VTTAYVGIGSNLKDPRAQVLQAFNELDGLPHTRVVKKSSLYRSAPVGHAAQPDFINAVAQLETGLPAERLLAEREAAAARLHQPDQRAQQRGLADAVAAQHDRHLAGACLEADAAQDVRAAVELVEVVDLQHGAVQRPK